jgi:Cu+-exporting ATPase
MNSHKIEGIPTKTKEGEFTDGNKDALYLSVSGNLAAMFIIEVTASTAVKKCMKQLEKNDIAVIVKSIDPFITISRLSALFNYSDELLKIIPQRMVKDFDEETQKVKKISASMACSGKFTSFVQLIMGTKSIRKTVAAGVAIQGASALLGLGLVALNCTLSAFSDISPTMFVAYHLICTVVTVLAVKIRKL